MGRSLRRPSLTRVGTGRVLPDHRRSPAGFAEGLRDVSCLLRLVERSVCASCVALIQGGGRRANAFDSPPKRPALLDFELGDSSKRRISANKNFRVSQCNRPDVEIGLPNCFAAIEENCANLTGEDCGLPVEME